MYTSTGDEDGDGDNRGFSASTHFFHGSQTQANMDSREQRLSFHGGGCNSCSDDETIIILLILLPRESFLNFTFSRFLGIDFDDRMVLEKNRPLIKRLVYSDGTCRFNKLSV